MLPWYMADSDVISMCSAQVQPSVIVIVGDSLRREFGRLPVLYHVLRRVCRLCSVTTHSCKNVVRRLTTRIILRIVVRSFRITIILWTLNSFLPPGDFAYHTHVSYALSLAHGTLNSFPHVAYRT